MAKLRNFVGLVPILKGAGCVVSDWSGRNSCYSFSIYKKGEVGMEEEGGGGGRRKEDEDEEREL